MTATTIVPIRFTDAEKSRLAQAAALAGYAHFSTYVRDRALDRVGYGNRANRDAEPSVAGAAQGEITGLRESLELAQAQLAMVLCLVARRATTGDINELRAAASTASDAAGLLKSAAPELAALIGQLQLPLAAEA